MQTNFDFDFATVLPASIPTTSALSAHLASSMPTLDPTLSISATDTLSTGMDLDLNFTDQELNDILLDVSYGLGDNVQLNPTTGSQ